MFNKFNYGVLSRYAIYLLIYLGSFPTALGIGLGVVNNVAAVEQEGDYHNVYDRKYFNEIHNTKVHNLVVNQIVLEEKINVK